MRLVITTITIRKKRIALIGLTLKGERIGVSAKVGGQRNVYNYTNVLNVFFVFL
jgi:hypothetical protein